MVHDCAGIFILNKIDIPVSTTLPITISKINENSNSITLLLNSNIPNTIKPNQKGKLTIDNFKKSGIEEIPVILESINTEHQNNFIQILIFKQDNLNTNKNYSLQLSMNGTIEIETGQSKIIDIIFKKLVAL